MAHALTVLGSNDSTEAALVILSPSTHRSSRILQYVWKSIISPLASPNGRHYGLHPESVSDGQPVIVWFPGNSHESVWRDRPGSESTTHVVTRCHPVVTCYPILGYLRAASATRRDRRNGRPNHIVRQLPAPSPSIANGGLAVAGDCKPGVCPSSGVGIDARYWPNSAALGCPSQGPVSGGKLPLTT